MQKTEVDGSRWYVIYTRLKEEDRVDQNLTAWEVETFAPNIKRKQINPYSGKVTYFREPLFPRYLFARFNAEKMMHKVLYTRGVQRLVSFNNTPVQVDDEIIALIRSRIGDDGFVRLNDDLRPGDMVTVKKGSMSGITGVFDRTMNDQSRVMILLEAINYQGSIIVERDAVQRLNHAYCN
ncbi:MAG TPA: transcription termination/antitermination NusG family protein [Pyrinomonadaceae bacterium]